MGAELALAVTLAADRDMRVVMGDRDITRTMSRAYDRSRRILRRWGKSEEEVGERARALWLEAKTRFFQGIPEQPVTEETLRVFYSPIF